MNGLTAAGYQSMSVARKQVEAITSSAPSTPRTKRIQSLTPVPIPGIPMPRTITPSKPWIIPPPTMHYSQPATPRIQSTLRSPAVATQSPKGKGILKSPEGAQVLNVNLAQTPAQGKKRKRGQGSKVVFTPDTKRT